MTKSPKKTSVKLGYDIVGDIHATVAPFRQLMIELGYQYKKNRGFIHPSGDRQLLFVGDFINKGQDNEEVLALVRPTIEQGGAVGVMGNHEFREVLNAQESQCRENVYGTFAEQFVFGSKKYKECVEWFKILPLYHQIPREFTLLHAQYNPLALKVAKELFLKDDLTLKKNGYTVALNADHCLHQVFKDTVGLALWGTEISVPDVLSRTSSSGKTQNCRRVSWWEAPDSGIEKVFNLNKEDVTGEQREAYDQLVAADPMWDSYFIKPQSTVFCGHIPRRGKELIGVTVHQNVACLDIKKGIVGYRYNKGDQGKLVADRVVYIEP